VCSTLVDLEKKIGGSSRLGPGEVRSESQEGRDTKHALDDSKWTVGGIGFIR